MPDLQYTSRAPIGPANIGSSRVADALADAVTLDTAAVVKLRDAVCAYVRVQRGMETPAEGIIARLKALANDSLRAGTPIDVRRSIIKTMVEWCIDAYYDDEHIDPSVKRAEWGYPEE